MPPFLFMVTVVLKGVGDTWKKGSNDFNLKKKISKRRP